MAVPQKLSEVRVNVATILQDTGYAIWTADDIDTEIANGCREVSRWKPFIFKETVSTVADSFDIDVSNILNLISVLEAEYKVDQNPVQRRNILKRMGNTITLDVKNRPASAADCYLWCTKIHTLVEPHSVVLSELAGAIDNGAGYAAGTVSLATDGWGAGTPIPKNCLLVITGCNGQYRLTADATVAGDSATLLIDPPLLEAVLDNAVITLSYSTFPVLLEATLAEYVAGKMALNIAFDKTNKINIGGARTIDDYQRLGTVRMRSAMAVLRRQEDGPSEYERYATA